jgi:Uma2 family endonuclease
MEPSVTKHAWTEAELMALPDVGGKYELVEGELIVGPAGFKHERIIMRLARSLDLYVETKRLGAVCLSNMGYWMKNGNLRCPDLSFISSERLKKLDPDFDRFFQGAPELAVEVLSPSDSLSQTKEKAREYCESGCRLVWIINPENATVLTMDPTGKEVELTAKDTLTGERVVPGFSLPVSRLFSDLTP